MWHGTLIIKMLILVFSLPAVAQVVGTPSGLFFQEKYEPPPVNKMRDGSLTSVGQGPVSWLDGSLSVANDGATSGTWFGRTADANPGNNNNRGLTLNFNSSLTLKKIVVWGYGMPYTAYIQYWNGSSWVTATTHAGPKTNPQEFTFNSGGTISSSKWRWYITGWSNPSNYYAWEVEAYE